MFKNKILIAASCAASVLLMTGCGPTPGPTPTPKSDLVGNYSSGNKEDADIVLYLKKDGTLLRAEGKRGGNFEKESQITGEPKGLGQKVADIQIWEHNGTLEDLKIEDGTADGQSAHAHSGTVNPPWNTHCHRYIQIDSQYVITHC